MTESDNMQISSLGWVRDEINKSLEEARTSLEGFVENSTGPDSTLLQNCANLIQQVCGTLEIVQLRGALVLATEMLELTQALLADADNLVERDAAYESLMRALVQLPDYLSRVQSGQVDTAIILLPLINDLRSSHGQDEVVAQSLFSPPTSGINPPQFPDVKVFTEGDLSTLMKHSRQHIHAGMLALFQDKEVAPALAKVIDVYEQFSVAAHAQSIKQLYWLSSAIFEAIGDDGLDIQNMPIKPLLGKIDAQTRIIIEEGEEKLSADPPTELIQDLLYYLAVASSEGQRVGNVKTAFRLQEHLPDEQTLSELRQKLTGPSAQVIETVIEGVTMELDRARDMLDIYSRTGGDDNDRLQHMVQALRNAAGTITMVDDSELSGSINTYCDEIEAVIAGNKTADEAGVPKLADFILQVDMKIQALRSENSGSFASDNGGSSLTSGTGRWDVTRAVVKESAVNMSNAKDIIATFVESPDSGREHLEIASDLFQQIAGSLKIASLDRASDIVYALRTYIDRELIKSEKILNEQELETLAEAVSSAGYYLEAVNEQLPHKENALDMAEAALDLLGYAAGDVDEQLAELAEDLEEEQSGTEISIEEDSMQLESLTDGLQEEFGGDIDLAGTTSFVIDTEKLAEPDDEDAPLEDVPLEQSLSEVEESAAEVEEIEVAPPVESEEEMSTRLAQMDDEVADLGELPSIEAVEEVRDAEVEEVSLAAPVESEEEMLARISEDLQEADNFVPDVGEIEVETVDSEIEAVSIEGAENPEVSASPEVSGIDEDVNETETNEGGALEFEGQGAQPGEGLFELEVGDDEPAEEAVEDLMVDDGAVESEADEGDATEVDDINSSDSQESLASSIGIEDQVGAEDEQPQTAEVESGSVSSMMSDSPLGDDLDDEIVEIFLEEVDEVLQELRTYFPSWRDSGDIESLTVIRRCFHTLKGSGRMVGATQIGEFSWLFESMLNKVLDGSVMADSQMMDTVNEAINVLPSMVEQLKGGNAADVDFDQIAATVQALSSGQSVPVADIDEKGVEDDDEQSIQMVAIIDEENSDSSVSLSIPLRSDELRKVYTDETNQLIDNLKAFIEVSREAEDPVYFDETAILTLHTLHGGSATVGAEPLMHIFDLLEPLAILYNEHREVVDDALLSLCERCIVQVQQFLDDANGSEQQFTADTELLEELRSLLQEKKHFLDAETDSISILNIMPSTEAGEDELAKGEDEPADGEALEEISSSLEDLHDLMSSEEASNTVTEADTGLFDDFEATASDAFAELKEDRIEHELALGDAGDVDPEIMEIFLEEAAELLATIEQTLNDWQNDQANQELLISVQRDIHTLKGGARMVNQSAVADVGHAMESLLTAVVDKQIEVSDELYSTLQAARDALQNRYDDLKAGIYDVPVDDQLIARLAALRSGKSEIEPVAAEDAVPAESEVEVPKPAQSADELGEVSSSFDLIEIFMEEAGELLESIDHTLDDWLNDESNSELPRNLQRDIHTLKGGARMVGLSGIGDLGHELETLLTAVVDGHIEITRPLFDGLHEVKDELQALYERAKLGEEKDAASEDMIKLLKALRTGKDVPSSPDMQQTDSDGTAHSDVMAVLDDDDSSVTSLSKVVAKAEITESQPQTKQEKRAGQRVEQETVRVRSDLIDGLVNLAGETNIFRSRLEQQSNTFRFSLSELDNTVVRLQEQLKKLESETDAQILFRHETEVDNPESENFDPLEMDRYSTMQQLSRSLIESVGDLNILQEMLGDLTRDSDLLLLQQGRVNSELQDRLMQARVVPFAATMASRLRRIIRQTCQQLNKKAELRIQGADEEMDRSVLERMVAPLEHMLRNSIAHGIESPEVRVSRDKPETGVVTISVSREGGEIVILIADDGGGLDTQAIREEAERKGLIIENADMTEEEVMQLVLTPGFSTAESISQIAGRGVGMDVVNNEIKQLNGSLNIDSVLERGAVMTVRLPFTLSITQALLVRVASDLFAIPLSSIEGVSRIARDEAEQLISGEESTYQYGGDDYRLSELSKLLGRQVQIEEAEESKPAIILVRAAGHRVGFYIDELLGNHEIVVKSLGAQISSVDGMAGGTIMGDGRVALILDVPSLVRMVGAKHGLTETRQVQAIETPKSVKLTVMVVDDSITVRRVTTRLLERYEMDVVTAKDGVDAIAVLEETVPDVMLLDVEMPRMDGYELATHMRNDERYQNVPIVMITSRTGSKHRERAEAIGVDRYLGKPYQEADLMENINQLVDERKMH